MPHCPECLVIRNKILVLWDLDHALIETHGVGSEL
jgi:hypothetical protein